MYSTNSDDPFSKLCSFDRERQGWQTPEYDELPGSSSFLRLSAYSALDMVRNELSV